MKRGLKAFSTISPSSPVSGYIPCPDEKGTESTAISQEWNAGGRVTFLAPMKRGLKGDPKLTAVLFCRSYIPCPDEKGTERADRPAGAGDALRCYIPCPDEKGTERRHFLGGRGFIFVTFLAPMKRGLKVCGLTAMARRAWRYIPCPDEKGTESLRPDCYGA